MFVGDVDLALRTEGEIGDSDKLARSFAPNSELVQEIAVFGAPCDAHAVRLVGVGPVGHIQHAVGTNGNRHGAAESGAGRRQKADHIVIFV